jgi:AcrR family transcriptional regulator
MRVVADGRGRGPPSRASFAEGVHDSLPAIILWTFWSMGKGIAKATLDDTRARTGTSKSQLFHYFPEGKDALLLAVAR